MKIVNNSPKEIGEKYIVKKCDIHHKDIGSEKQDPFRNCWIRYYPEKKPVQEDVKIFKLSHPRISKCGNFFEEDTCFLTNPEKPLGVAQFTLTDDHKLILRQPKLGKELIQSLFEKTAPEFLIMLI